MIRRIGAAACVVLLCLSSASPAEAWVPYGFVWDPPSVTFNYNDGSFASSGLPIDSVRNHLTAAGYTWIDVGCTVLSINIGGTTSTGYQTGRPIDGENVIYWESNGASWDSFADSTTYAMTNYAFNNFRAEDTDIMFNGAGITDSDLNPLQWVIDTSATDGIDFESVAVHEMGHAIGLDHERFIRSSLMYPAIFGGDVRRSLSFDDVAAVCILYPNPFSFAGMSEECATDHDCSTGTCAFDGTNRFCAIGCTGDCDCPLEDTCTATATAGVSVCTTGTNACTMRDEHMFAQNGAACTTSIECLSNLCYHPPTGASYCTRRCSSDCDCNADYACDVTQSLCLQSTGPTSCVSDAGVPAGDAGVPSTGDGGATPPASSGGCSVGNAHPSTPAAILVGLTAVLGFARRRRARRR